MTARVGLCVDSTAQLPVSLMDRLAVEVVPLTLHVGDDEYLEGVDLTADDWYERLGSTARPVGASLGATGGVDAPGATHGARFDVTAPSPGQFALAFEDLLARGCTELLSIHSAAPLCADPEIPACAGSVKAARLAAHRLGVPVRVLEVPAAGFAVGCCAWVAIESAAAGASLDEVARLVEAAAPRIRHLFLSAPPSLLARGGSTPGGPKLSVCTVTRVPEAAAAEVSVVGDVDTVLDAVNVMSTSVVSAVPPGGRVRVAIGHGAADVEPVADALAAAVGETVVVDEVLRYRIGPSSSRITGPGVVRCFVLPAEAFSPSDAPA